MLNNDLVDYTGILLVGVVAANNCSELIEPGFYGLNLNKFRDLNKVKELWILIDNSYVITSGFSCFLLTNSSHNNYLRNLKKLHIVGLRKSDKIHCVVVSKRFASVLRQLTDKYSQSATSIGRLHQS